MSIVSKIEKTRAKRIGSVSPSHKALLGQYLTPIEVARFMAMKLIQFGPQTGKVTLLDPGAGTGTLFCSFLDQAASSSEITEISVDAYEIDETIIPHLQDLSESVDWPKVTNISIIKDDFLKCATHDIQWGIEKRYTHIIMNPPYKKMNVGSLQSKLLMDIGIETVNLYSAFLATCLKLLDIGGVVTAIIPRSFCNGLYFLPFRKQILTTAEILQIHSFESRVDTFSEESVLQENIIVVLRKGSSQPPEVVLSHSKGRDLSFLLEERVSFQKIVNPKDTQKYISIPKFGDQIDETDLTLSATSQEIGIEISTGPIVDFRMKDKLVFDPGLNAVPLLYPVHFKNGSFRWPVESRKANEIVLDDKEKKKLCFAKGNYVVVKRFSSKEEKRRVWASIIRETDIPTAEFTAENHLNIIHSNRHGLDESLTLGLFVFLNSNYLDKVFRRFSGHTQVNATDLRNIRYPSVDQLQRAGKAYADNPSCPYDEILHKVVQSNGK